MKHYFMDVMGYLSLLIYPYKLSHFFSLLFDHIASRRFRFLTHNVGKVLLERPFYVIGHKFIKYENFYSHAGLRLECWDMYQGIKFNPSIVIGKNVCFNYRCHIGAIDNITIGDNVLVGSNVLITAHSHGYNDQRDCHIYHIHEPYQPALDVPQEFVNHKNLNPQANEVDNAANNEVCISLHFSIQ